LCFRLATDACLLYLVPQGIRLYASASSTPKSFSLVRWTLATSVLLGSGYVGAAYYANHDPQFRKLWIESGVPGGEAALDAVKIGAEKIQSTSIQEVQEQVSVQTAKVTQTIGDYSSKASETLGQATQTATELKQSFDKKLGEAVQAASDAKDVATATISKIATTVGGYVHDTVEFVGKVQEATVDTYHKVENSVKDASNKVVYTFESVKSTVTGQPAPEKPKKSASIPPATETKPSPASSPKKPEAPETVAAPAAAKESSQPRETTTATVPAVAAAAATVAAVEVAKSEAAAAEKSSSEARPSNDEALPASDSAPVATLPEFTLPEITHEHPSYRRMAEGIHALSEYIGSYLQSHPDERLAKARETLVDLSLALAHIEAEEARHIDRELEKQSEQFKAFLDTEVLRFQIALAEQHEAESLKHERVLATERDQHKAELISEIERLNDLFKSELVRQSKDLDEYWQKEIKARVDQERDGRLARLDHLSLKLMQLEKISIDAGEFGQLKHRIHLLQTALKALRGSLDANTVQPFSTEIQILRKLGKGDALIESVLESIPEDVSRSGIVPFDGLKKRFYSVAKYVRQAQLMPEKGGPISYIVSRVSSNLLFKKHGLIPGEDCEAILARTEQHLRLGELEQATRELNQLKGWPKILAGDWLKAARRHLEVRQAIEVSPRNCATH
ncbi:mitochondrial inner membrane protein Mitofilin, partial [Polychytrium aggregatum]|uniref:mitochondrial inner membrane protein Mitofilin n=1 Tax=Polychytrium aggregatum TaxID=110093 RepID=UPI0022FDD240